MLAPDRELDVTEPVVRAIAGHMAAELGGNEQLNLLEAELHLRRIMRQPGSGVGAAAGARR
jgi:hypothetical protein